VAVPRTDDELTGDPEDCNEVVGNVELVCDREPVLETVTVGV